MWNKRFEYPEMSCYKVAVGTLHFGYKHLRDVLLLLLNAFEVLDKIETTVWHGVRQPFTRVLCFLQE